MNDYDDWSQALRCFIECVEATSWPLERLIEIVEAAHLDDQWAQHVLTDARKALDALDRAHDEWAQPIMRAYPPRIEQPFVWSVTR